MRNGNAVAATSAITFGTDMETSDFKKAACRLFFDMINADGIIEDDEIVNLEILKDKYYIKDEDVIKAHQITTSQAISILKNWKEECDGSSYLTSDGLYTTHSVIVDLTELSGCDGDRDINEAKLLGVVILCLTDAYNARPITYRERAMRFSRREIVYLSCFHNKDYADEIEKSKPYFECLLSVYGYDFIYIPHIVKFLSSKLEINNDNSDKLTPIIKFTKPSYLTTGDKASGFSKAIQHVTTEQFSCDFMNDAHENCMIGPHLLVKIKTTTIPEKDHNGNEEYVKYTDFIALPILHTVEETLKSLPEMILSHTKSITSVVRRQLIDKLYCKGFHKTLIDYVVSREDTLRDGEVQFIYNIEKKAKNNKTMRLTRIEFNHGEVSPIPLATKEWIIYLMIVYLSAMKGGKGLPKKINNEIQLLFKKLYKILSSRDSGIDNSFVTNLSNINRRLKEIVNMSDDYRKKICIVSTSDYYKVGLNIESVVVIDHKLKEKKKLKDWIDSL